MINNEINNNLILVTGCAGFIGFHSTKRLLELGFNVIGLDNLNNYYDVSLKYKNINELNKFNNFIFCKGDIRNTNIINEYKPKKILHLAGMAGVRNSIENPKLYYDINVNGFKNLLEQSKNNNVELVVYASSSSVYGNCSELPFNENINISKCESPYAYSKKYSEIISKYYYNFYNVKSIGLRFFTVYGPRGRPDMAPYLFLNNIMNNNSIIKYGDGNSTRDYTYIDDIVDGIISALINKNNLKWEIFNLGNSSPISLNKFIELCEKIVGKKAIIEHLDKHNSDVNNTFADIKKANKLLDYNPKVLLEEGLLRTYEYMKVI